ncbi:MAG: hypothetical protein R3E39_25805 [Anaerolineae bacterium]
MNPLDDDVQVIAPMYRGPAGVNALNDALQAALSSSSRQAEKRLAGGVPGGRQGNANPQQRKERKF